jgi:hypothetical protein
MAVSEVWVDAFDYGCKILCGDRQPWANPIEFAAMIGQLGQLLPADAQVVPIHGALPKPSPVTTPEDYLKELDARIEGEVNEPLTNSLSAVASAVIKKVVLTLPGPSILALGSSDDNVLDEASFVLAGLLRSLGRYPFFAVMIAETDPRGAPYCESAVRLGRHLGLRMALFGGEYPSFDVSFPDAANGVVPEEWWKSNSPLPSGHERLLIKVPHDGNPELILARMRRDVLGTSD